MAGISYADSGALNGITYHEARAVQSVVSEQFRYGAPYASRQLREKYLIF